MPSGSRDTILFFLFPPNMLSFSDLTSTSIDTIETVITILSDNSVPMINGQLIPHKKKSYMYPYIFLCLSMIMIQNFRRSFFKIVHETRSLVRVCIQHQPTRSRGSTVLIT